MILDNVVKLGELVVRGAIVTYGVATPIVIKSAKIAGKFGEKELELAQKQLDKSTVVIKADYAKANAKIAKATDEFAAAFAKMELPAAK